MPTTMSNSSPLLNPIHVPRPTAPSISGFVPSTLAPSYSIHHAHVLRLHDVLLHLLSLAPSRTNSEQCLRAWYLLAQCHQLDLTSLYRLGGLVLARSGVVDTDPSAHGHDERDDDDDEEDERVKRVARMRAEWYKANLTSGTQRDDATHKIDRLQEFVLSLASSGQSALALEELQSYLPAHPYHDSIQLHVLEGQLALLVAQSLSGGPPPHTSSSSLAAKRTSSRPHHLDLDSDSSSSSDEADQHARSRDRATYRFLTYVASSSPILYDQAKEAFRQASRLHRKHKSAVTLHDEGTRWLNLMTAAEAHQLKRSKQAIDTHSP
ncbi:BZ3500_MvSof-1268-A1-R1_Chr1-1g00834 [Microbotryum saponariae]|uniref:BZ3500_MvSof-1268-A1-R1_Chr1-1g00834 protein n=1 Tax=Microbotryum saponariae TaxID=289078 RepID=A0A2X0K7E4_9BASI|nr:BZ3500_MvSof-1268-A1-R1_Chr1-1g00834 [Microbotryum saponariae]SCZ92756.1 BZ3501_MvSof-1269-A2-R1_Chr1-1g00431 [Microbotryum saponariae]